MVPSVPYIFCIYLIYLSRCSCSGWREWFRLFRHQSAPRILQKIPLGQSRTQRRVPKGVVEAGSLDVSETLDQLKPSEDVVKESFSKLTHFFCFAARILHVNEVRDIYIFQFVFCSEHFGCFPFHRLGWSGRFPWWRITNREEFCGWWRGLVWRWREPSSDAFRGSNEDLGYDLGELSRKCVHPSCTIRWFCKHSPYGGSW